MKKKLDVKPIQALLIGDHAHERSDFAAGRWDGVRRPGIRGHRFQCGEVVFNTCMTGYQEILTDPSYHEQIITMTYPLIGNYGTNTGDWESRKIFASGFIVKENCEYPSNWRNEASLDGYLKKNKVVGIEGIDTRKLVRHIRTQGAMRGIISSDELDPKKLTAKLAKYPGLVGRDIVSEMSVDKSYAWDKGVLNVLNPNQPMPAGQVQRHRLRFRHQAQHPPPAPLARLPR